MLSKINCLVASLAAQTHDLGDGVQKYNKLQKAQSACAKAIWEDAKQPNRKACAAPNDTEWLCNIESKAPRSAVKNSEGKRNVRRITTTLFST